MLLNPRGPDPSSCKSCRKKKTKCNRVRPTCDVCKKHGHECVYEEGKPLWVSGKDVDVLKDRIAYLEASMMARSMLLGSIGVPAAVNNLDAAASSSSNNRVTQRSQQKIGQHSTSRSPPRTDSRKKQKRENSANAEPRHGFTRRLEDFDITESGLPSEMRELFAPTMMQELVDIYFDRIHPFLPIVHPSTFTERLSLARSTTLQACLELDDSILDPDKPLRVISMNHRKLLPLLDAIAVISVVFLPTASRAPQELVLEELLENGRNRAVLAFYHQPTLEALQAIAILATERIAQGKPLRGWSLIGVLSRASVQCGLNKERFQPFAALDEASYASTGDQEHHLLRAVNMLPPPNTHSEAEEQRRIFWAIFILDRTASTAIGQPNVLGQMELDARLPTSELAFLTLTDMSSPSTFGSMATSFRGSRREKTRGQNFVCTGISVFGCLIEAAECLGLAQSFLLQPANASDSDQRRARLTTINEELSAWKRCLPDTMVIPNDGLDKQWDCLDPDGKFSPQIILAHAMYNSASIILNQELAWPDTETLSPSAISFEKASTGIANMVTLLSTSIQHMHRVHPFVGFFIFLSAKALLARLHHSFFYPEQWADLDLHKAALHEIGQTWGLAAYFECALTKGIQEVQQRMGQPQKQCVEPASQGSPSPHEWGLSATTFSKRVTDFLESSSKQSMNAERSHRPSLASDDNFLGTNVSIGYNSRINASHGQVLVPLPGRMSRSASFVASQQGWMSSDRMSMVEQGSSMERVDPPLFPTWGETAAIPQAESNPIFLPFTDITLGEPISSALPTTSSWQQPVPRVAEPTPQISNEEPFGTHLFDEAEHPDEIGWDDFVSGLGWDEMQEIFWPI